LRILWAMLERILGDSGVGIFEGILEGFLRIHLWGFLRILEDSLRILRDSFVEILEDSGKFFCEDSLKDSSGFLGDS